MGGTERTLAFPPLRRHLGVVDFFTLAFGSIVGVGWVVVMDDWLGRGGPLGAALGFGAAGLLLLPIGIIYGRLIARLPLSDGEMAYTAGLLPTGGRFAAGWMMTMAYLAVCPYEAVAVGQLAAGLVPALETVPLYHVGEHTVYLPGLLVGLGLVLFLTAVNYRGVRHSAWVQTSFTFGLLAVFVVFSVLGLLRGRADNLAPPFAHADQALPAALSVFLVLQIAPYFMAGFETVARCAEERHADFAEHRFVAITVTALAAGTFFYASVILVVALLHPWQELAREPSATLVAFRRAFGSELLVNLILFGAILSLIKVFNGCLLGASRLLFAMGRAGMVPAVLGDVHHRYHTPRTAIVLVGVLAAGGCFLGKAVLVPISEVGSFAYAVGWLAACLAFLGGVGQGSHLERWGLGLIGATVCVLMLGMKLVPGVPGSFNRWEYAALLGWVVLGAVLWSLRPATSFPHLDHRLDDARLGPGPGGEHVDHVVKPGAVRDPGPGVQRPRLDQANDPPEVR